MNGNDFMTCWHERFIGYIYICIVVFCMYTNRDYETRTDRAYRLVNNERRMYYATEINYVSPKIFGSCFWLRGRLVRACIIY
jgi:hypothetical protein